MTLRIKLGAATGILLGALGAQAWGQTPHLPTGQSARHAEAKSKTKATDDASHQGITVHGHWVMNVRDPDGKIVAHRDFENSLNAGGANVLTNLLLGSMTPGYLTINVQQIEANGGIAQSGEAFPAAALPLVGTNNECTRLNCGPNLTVTPVIGTDIPNFPYYRGLTLSGSIKTVAAYAINTVSTGFNGCTTATTFLPFSTTLQTLSPTTCPGTLVPQLSVNANTQTVESTFTSVTIPSLPLAVGQTLDITVTITFT